MMITPHESTSPTDALESELTALLARQIALAKQGKPDEVMELIDEVDSLLSRADQKQAAQVWAKGAVRSLYDELGLVLGVAMRELSGEAGRARKGKNSIAAYKGLSGY